MPVSTLICVLAVAKRDSNNDARDVIQASLLSFFEPRHWHSADWKPKNQVVLRPSYIPHPSSNFDAKFNSFNDVLVQLETHELRSKRYFEKAKPKAKDQDSKRKFLATRRNNFLKIEVLAYVRARVGKNPGNSMIHIPEIAQMEFDPRIVVTNKSNRIRFGAMERDESLEQGTVYAHVGRPFFSPDERFAIVTMSIPWSMHSADVHFVLEQKDTGWKIISTSPMFYL